MRIEDGGWFQRIVLRINMRIKKTNRLVRRLGMSYELKPLLDNPGAYGKFENVINLILEKMKGTHPRIKHLRKHYYYEEGLITYRSIVRVNEAIECFRKNYGIKVPERTHKQIAKELGIEERCIKRDAGGREWRVFEIKEKLKTDSKHKGSYGKNLVGLHVNFIEKVLKQRHKEEI